MQAERVEEAVAVAAVEALTHIERDLLGEVDERLINDLEQALARREVDARALVVERLDIDVDVRRDDLLDEVIADAFALQEFDLVLDDAVEVKRLLVGLFLLRTRAPPARRLDNERLGEVLRELRERLAVRRERQKAVLDGLRQHLEIDLDVVRVVDAVEERLRAEQLDVALDLADVARTDAAEQALDGLDADANGLFHALRLIGEEEFDDVELLTERARGERGDRDDVRDAPHEGLRKRRVRVLRRRADDEHFGMAVARRLAEAAERPRVHEVEDHLLPLRRQAVDLVEEEHAAVRLLDESRLRLVSACESSLDMAEDMREQELRVVVVVRAVERHERRVRREALHRLAVGEHEVREERLADARLSDDERMQPIRRVEDCGLRLLDLPLETAVRADERVEGILRLLLRREFLLAGRDALIGERPRGQRRAEQLLECRPLKVAHGPPAELHDAILTEQRVELLRDIVAQDAERVRDLLRIESAALTQRFLRKFRRLRLHIGKDPLHPFHPKSSSSLLIHFISL